MTISHPLTRDCLSLLAAILVFNAGIGSAATVTWTGTAGNGLWSDPANWDTSTIPAAADDVIIPTVSGSPLMIHLDGNRVLGLTSLSITGNGIATVGAAGTSNQITFAATSPNISVASGVTLNLNAQVPSGALNISGGGTIFVDNYFNLNGAVLVDNATTLRVVNRMPVTNTIGGIGQPRGDTAQLGGNGSNDIITLSNGGTFNYSGPGLNPDGGSKVPNLGAGGGVINVAGGSSYNMDDAGQITGAGNLTKEGLGRLIFATSNYNLAGNSITNAGFLDVRGNGTAAGTFSLLSTHTVNGGVFAINNGNLAHGGMTLNIGGSIGVQGGDREFGDPAGTSTIALNGGNILTFDYLDGQTGRNPRINSYAQGSGTINLIGGVQRNAVVFQRYLEGSTTFTGRIIVNDNTGLENNPRSSGNIGAAIGSGTIELKGFNALLDIRDNGAGSNGTLAYGNNVEVTNTDKASIQTLALSNAGANTGNSIALGSLTMGANRMLQINPLNSYGATFTAGSFGGSAIVLTGTNGATGPDSLTFLDNAVSNLSESVTGSSFSKVGLDASTTDTSRLNIQDSLLFSTVNLVQGMMALNGANGQIDVGAISGTGSLNISNRATLLLDDSMTVAAGQRVAAATSVNMYGGTISLLSNIAAATTSNQIISNLSVATGAVTLDATRGNAGALSVLEVGNTSFSRALTSVVNFTGTSLGTAGNTGRILIDGQGSTSFLGGWAVSGNEFAKYDTTEDSGFALGVTPLAAADYALNPLETDYTTGLNIKASNALATAVTLTGNRDVNSLNIQGVGVTTLALGANRLTLESGGLLSSGATHIITSTGLGGLTAGTTLDPAQLFITTNNDLTIGAGITNNAATGEVTLVKSGAGTLILNQTTTNTSTGGIVVNQGTLRPYRGAALGANTNLITLAGGTLDLNIPQAGSNGSLAGLGHNVVVSANGSSITLDNNGEGTGSGSDNNAVMGSLTFTAPTSATGATLSFGGFDSYDASFNGVALANTPTIEMLGTNRDVNSILTLGGDISGTGGFNVVGPTANAGALEIGAGAADTTTNTYTGDVNVLGGTVVFNKAATAITGDLIINSATTLVSFKNTIALSNPFAASSRVYLLNGVLGNSSSGNAVNPRDFIGVVPELIMKGGSLNSGWNSLTINKATISGGAITVNGTYNLGGTLTLNDTTLLHGAPTINIQAPVGADFSVLNLGGSAGFSTTGQNIFLNQASGAFTLGSIVNLSTNVTVTADPLALNSYSSGMRIEGTTTNALELTALLDLQGGDRTFTIGTDAFYTIQPNVVNGGLTKAGNGTLILSSFLNESTFDGAVNVNSGVLNVRNNTSLGSTVGSTTVAEGATLELEAGLDTAENFTLSGLGNVANMKTAAVVSRQGSSTLSGNVTLNNGASLSSWGHQAIPDAGFPAITGNTNFTLYSDLKLTGPMSGTGDLVLRGDGSGTVSGAISANGGLYKDGAGQWNLMGANSYAGLTEVAAGVLNVANATGLGTTAGGTRVYGGASLLLEGDINIGAEALELHGTGMNNQGGTLVGVSGVNVATGPLTLFTDVQNSSVAVESRAGSLTLSGAVTSATNANLIINGAGNTTFSGGLATGAGTLTKNGNGTLTLAGNASTFTGATTVAGGTLSVGTATSQLADGAALNMAGGNLTLTGAGNETVSNLNLVSGGAEVNLGGATLTSSSILSRLAGATVNFTAAGNLVAGQTNSNGIIGAFATLGGSDWAVDTGTGVTALASYFTLDEDMLVPTSGITAPATSDNVLINSTFQTTTNTAIIANTLKIAGSGTRGIGQNGLDVTLGAGGLLYDGTIGSNVGLSGSGILSTGSAGEMIFHIKDGALDTNMVIVGSNGLTKDGTGTLVLSGANTFTGNINVNGGTLAIVGPNGTTDPTALGALGARAINLNGGTFALLAGSFNPSVTTKSMVIGAAGGTIHVASGEGQSGQAFGSMTLDDAGQFSGLGTLTKTGNGRLIITQTNAFSGDVNIQGGVLETQGNGALGLSQAQQIITIGNGARFENGAGELFSSIVVQDGGTLGARGSTSHIIRGTTTFEGTSTIALVNQNNFGQSENYLLEGVVNLDAAATLNVIGRSNGNPLNLGNAANNISGTIVLNENATMLALHAGSLGSNPAARATIELETNARLRIADDTTADFLANIEVHGHSLLDVRSASVSNSAHVLSLNTLSMDADKFLTVSGAQSFQLRFGGAANLAGGASDVTVIDAQQGGLLFDGGLTSTAGTFEKLGGGQLVLRAASSFGGEFRQQAGDTVLRMNGSLDGVTAILLKGGRILSDNTEGVDNDRIPDGAAITLYGGQIYNSHNETIGAITLNGHANQIRQGVAATLTTPQVLTITSLTRNTGGSANFAAENGGSFGGTGSSPRIVITGAAGGFMGGSYTVNGDWAQYLTAVDSGFARGVATFNTYTTANADSAAWSNTTHLNLSGSIVLAGNREILTLRNDNANRTVTLGANNLVVDSGGILQINGNTLTLGANTTDAGTITANGDGTSAAELFLHVQGGALQANAILANNGTGAVSVVKTGGSTLTLANINNSFTGGLYINQGTVAVTSAGATANLQPALGNVAGSDIIMQGGTLQVRNDATNTSDAIIADGHDVFVRANSVLSVDRSTNTTTAPVRNTLAMGALSIEDATLTVRNNIDNTAANPAANYSVSFTGGNVAGVAILDWARNATGAGGTSTGPGTVTAGLITNSISRLTIAGAVTGDSTADFYNNSANAVVFGGGLSDTSDSTWLSDVTLNAGTTYLNKADGADNFSMTNITLNGGNLTLGLDVLTAGVGDDQINDAAKITINAGIVDLLRHNETIGSLEMNGGFFRTDSAFATAPVAVAPFSVVNITGDAVINAVGDNSGLLADNRTTLNIGGALKIFALGRVVVGGESGTINVGSLELTGGNILINLGSGPSNFGLGGNVTTFASNQSAVISGANDSDSFLNLNGNRIFTVADGLATDDLIVSVIMRNTAGGVGATPFGFTKEGLGKMVMSGTSPNNSFTGAVNVNAGTLELARNAGANVISGSALTIASGATVLQRNSNQIVNAAVVTVDGVWDLDFGNASETAANVQGTNAAAEIRVGPGSTLTNNVTDTVTYAGHIYGSGTSDASSAGPEQELIAPTAPTTGAIVKTGAGVWDLTGDSELSGNLLVTAGEVSMNGSMSGNTTFVQGTAILSGAGDLASNDGVLSNVSVQTGSRISPGQAGASITTVGMLTVKDDLRLRDGSNVDLQLGGSTLNDAPLLTSIGVDAIAYDAYTSAALAGWEGTLSNGTKSLSHDRISVLGNLEHDNNGKFNVALLAGYTPNAGDVFDLLDWTTLLNSDPLVNPAGTTSYGTGLLTNGGALGDLNLPVLGAGLQWDVQFFQSNGILLVVPEPGRALLLFIGMAAFVIRRRRSRGFGVWN
jgi:fibronectin-binding autotransporter adhesin